MVDDKKDKEGLLDKDITRRGFIGVLGGVAAAAAIPLSWAADSSPIPTVAEEVAIEQSIDGTTWEPKPESHWISTKSPWVSNIVRTKTPTMAVSTYRSKSDLGARGVPVLIGTYDLQAYDINVTADVIEITGYGTDDRFYTRGPKNAEVNCTVLGEQFITELLKNLDRKLHVVIDTGAGSNIAFEFDGYVTSATQHIESQYYDGQPLLGNIIFRSATIQRTIKDKQT